MADTEFQQEFNLEAALSALRSTPADNPWQAAAEGWIQTHVADLEAKAKVAAMIVRVAVTEVRPGDALVFTLRDEPLSLHDYAVVRETVERLVREKFGPDVKSLVVNGADVSVVRTMRDAGRCLLGFPSSNGKFVCRCVLPACHEGRHDNGNGDTWPESEPTHVGVPVQKCDRGHIGCGDEHFREAAQIKEDEPRSLFSVDGAGQPAPDHLSEERLPKRDLATGELLEQECDSVQVFFGRDVMCARERWHTGPHMDATAIAHAGKAGEVWE